jgi:hypothetical protein
MNSGVDREYLIPDLTSIEATQRSTFSGRIRCRARSLMPILRSNPSLPARGRTLRVLSPLRLQYITKRAPIRVPFLLCMEARGVEPLSEGIAHTSFYGCSYGIVVAIGTPRNRLPFRPA